MSILLKVIRNAAYAVALAPVAAVAAPLMIANLAAQQSITLVRTLREKVNEENGDCFFVYYPLENTVAATTDYILPEIVGVDLIAGALNLKM